MRWTVSWLVFTSVAAGLPSPTFRPEILTRPCLESLARLRDERRVAVAMRYNILSPRLVGVGAWGRVVEGTMPESPSGVTFPEIARPGGRVVIKIPLHTSSLEHDQRSEAAIVQEADMLARVFRAERGKSHLFVRGIRDPEHNVLVLEPIDGVTLSDWMANPRAVRTQEQVDRILKGLDEAREVLRRAGIVHGDLYPDNIMVLPDGNIRVIDLGFAAPVGPRPAYWGDAVVGTNGYRSSNQEEKGPVRFEDDDHALAVIHWEVKEFARARLPPPPGRRP